MNGISPSVYREASAPVPEKKENEYANRPLAKRLPMSIIFKLISYLQLAETGALAQSCPNIKIWSAFGQRYRPFKSTIQALPATEQERAWMKVARIHALKRAHCAWGLKSQPSVRELLYNPANYQLLDGNVILGENQTVCFYSAGGRLLDTCKLVPGEVTKIALFADKRFEVGITTTDVVSQPASECNVNHSEMYKAFHSARGGFFNYLSKDQRQAFYISDSTNLESICKIPYITRATVKPMRNGRIVMNTAGRITILHPTAGPEKSWGFVSTVLQDQQWGLMSTLPDGRLFVGEGYNRYFWDPNTNVLSQGFFPTDYGIAHAMNITGIQAFSLSDGRIIETPSSMETPSSDDLTRLWSSSGELLACCVLPLNFVIEAVRITDDQCIELVNSHGICYLWQPTIEDVDRHLALLL